MNDNQKAILALVRAGLWEKEVQLSSLGRIDWDEIYQLSAEQSVTGLVLTGIEHSDVKPSQELLLQWIGEVQIIEQQNKAMNEFVAKLIEKLRYQDVYAVLVKGQGIAQCYEKPLWRACGDVDLLLSNDNYKKAKKLLLPLATSHEEEAVYAMHLGITIDSWVVELHGTLRSNCLRRMDRVIDEVQNDVFIGGNVRSWQNGKTQVFLPGINNDLFFVFTHILKHFYRGGIGLRQICDWCRLLWIYRESIDVHLLSQRLRWAGIMAEWRAFAELAVDYLGMPVEAMPFYSSKDSWKKKAKRILDFIMETGNFGHNRDNIYQERYYIVQKIRAFWRRVADAINHVMLFPTNSIRVFFRTLYDGIIGFAQGK